MKQPVYPPKELTLTVEEDGGVWIAAGSKTPVYVKIKEIKGRRVKLFICAPEQVKILREKLCDENGRPIVPSEHAGVAGDAKDGIRSERGSGQRGP